MKYNHQITSGIIGGLAFGVFFLLSGNIIASAIGATVIFILVAMDFLKGVKV